MQRPNLADFQGSSIWLGYVGALVAVGLITVLLVVFLEITSLSQLLLLYLFAVLISAEAFGWGPAITAAVAAGLMLDWFFIDPIYSCGVPDADDSIALVL